MLLSFLVEAWAEFYTFVRSRIGHSGSIEEAGERMLETIGFFSDQHPRLFQAPMAGQTVIDADGPGRRTVLQNWGQEWDVIMGEVLRHTARPSITIPISWGQTMLRAMLQGWLKGTRDSRGKRPSTICGCSSWAH